jgi:hypothetical protein
MDSQVKGMVGDFFLEEFKVGEWVGLERGARVSKAFKAST